MYQYKEHFNGMFIATDYPQDKHAAILYAMSRSLKQDPALPVFISDEYLARNHLAPKEQDVAYPVGYPAPPQGNSPFQIPAYRNNAYGHYYPVVSNPKDPYEVTSVFGSRGAHNMKYLDQDPWDTNMPYSMLKGFPKWSPFPYHPSFTEPQQAKLSLVPLFSKTLYRQIRRTKMVLSSKTYWKCSLGVWDNSENVQLVNEHTLPKFLWVLPQWLEPFRDQSYPADFRERLRLIHKKVLGT